LVRAREGAAVDRGLKNIQGNFALLARACTAAVFALVLGAAAPAPKEPSPKEIVVGTHVDLSGPLAQLGTAVRNGLVTAFDEINAKGGVNGRKLRLVVADNGYNPRKAVSAVKTFLTRDHVLAVLCPVGTPPIAKTMPLILNSGTLHLFPFGSVDETPQQSLAFAIDLPAAQQIAVGLRAILAERGSLKVGVLYRSDGLGQAALKGASDELAAQGARPVGVASYSPGDLNFTAALASLHEAGAELVVLGGIPQEAIFAMQQAAAQNWLPVFLCDQACYVPELPPLGGRTVAGLYAVATTPIPYPDDKDQKLRVWVRRYEQRFGTVASQQAFRAYLDARVFAEAVRRAGADPTPRHVARMLELMSPWKDPDYGGIPVVFAPHDHVGFRTGFLAQVRNGRWTTLTGALPPALRPH
jgi:ABC-type branched-subunit amino acid transport system substrate-binding protein